MLMFYADLNKKLEQIGYRKNIMNTSELSQLYTIWCTS